MLEVEDRRGEWMNDSRRVFLQRATATLAANMAVKKKLHSELSGDHKT